MRADMLQLAADLSRSGEAFVLAVVVRRESASSAQVGNTAVITEAGECHGWLGGSCIQSTVLREAAAALAAASPRLISLAPDPDGDRRAGIMSFPMTCHSGGSVDIYLEPVLSPARLLVFGVSPTAQAIVRLGKVMGYAVDAVDPEADRATFPDADRITATVNVDELAARPASQKDRLFAVVATLGRRDEQATLAALRVEPAYLGVVASRKRFAEMRTTLVAAGASASALDSIASPAGLDIGARAPEEVALSILAEIVQVRRAASQRAIAEAVIATESREERDPVCGMTVVADTTRHRAEHGGRTYYFCCGGCQQRFVADPERYDASPVS
ncbi:MAG TPA: XdhC family protein [Vicinamibacterales bacterium]|nr:XdhC family protein [Vicinamibacterales bacterium]